MKSSINLIIAGSRGFRNYPLLQSTMFEVEDMINILSVVSGTARGADQLGERWAEESGIPISRFPANWDKYGKGAGYIRNKEMAENADMLLAFWDGKSAGTKHMINESIKQGLIVRVVFYE